MQTITCIVRDNYPGYHDPLIYTVQVENPQNQNEVLSAVEIARIEDIGGSPADEVGLDLEVLFAFPGDLRTVADWRE